MFSLLLFMSRVHSRGLGRQRPGSPHLRISTRATGRCVCVCVCRSPVILQSDPGIFLRSAFFLQSVRFGSSLSGLEFGRENRSPTSLGPSCPPDFPLAQRALPLRPSPSHDMGSGRRVTAAFAPEGRSVRGSSSLLCAQPLALYQMLPGSVCTRLL